MFLIGVCVCLGCFLLVAAGERKGSVVRKGEGVAVSQHSFVVVDNL
jgi:hypothetical protein